MNRRGPVVITSREQRPHWLVREAQTFERERRNARLARMTGCLVAPALSLAVWIALLGWLL